MCGILFYYGTDEIPLRTIFSYAIENKHRGEDDGFGYIDIEHNTIHKSILSLTEIDKLSLSKDRLKKLKKEEQIALTKAMLKMSKELDKTTHCVLFHHRKASCGGIKLANTHPIPINKDIYYVHNGSVPEVWALRNYLHDEKKYMFGSLTDTEVLGFYIEEKLKENKDYFYIFDRLKKIFCSFGVIMRYDRKTKELVVFKDDDRPLYLYTIKNNMLLISEPLLSLGSDNKCMRIDSAVFSIKDGKVSEHAINVTKDVTPIIVKYTNKDEKRGEVFTHRDYDCDNCKSNHNSLNITGAKDFCLTCLTGVKEVLDEKKEKTKENDNGAWYFDFKNKKWKRTVTIREEFGEATP